MEAAMIVDLPDTNTNDINKKITGLREEGGAITLSRVLTLVISLESEDVLEDSIEAANFASREHPCRVIVVVHGERPQSRDSMRSCASVAMPARARSYRFA
jgi:glucose-6-phosphate dehydrogenase assembly protein OpcA